MVADQGNRPFDRRQAGSFDVVVAAGGPTTDACHQGEQDGRQRAARGATESASMACEP
jgi:hypothetical protein